MSSKVIHAVLPFVAAFAATCALVVASPQAAAGQDDEHPKLPPGEGRDVMIRVCSQCHEPEMVVDQQTDEAGWKTVVDQMANNGANATEAEFQQIVKYLTKAFPAK